MVRGIVTIDQTPCRASYGLFSPSALLRDTTNRQKAAVMENIARFVSDGDRMAQIENKRNTIPAIAADSNYSEPPDVVLTSIDRPDIRWREISGAFVDIFI